MIELIGFVNKSDFYLVYYSNTPDSLTNLLLLTNKKIVHDTHDMGAFTLEYITNVKAMDISI